MTNLLGTQGIQENHRIVADPTERGVAEFVASGEQPVDVGGFQTPGETFPKSAQRGGVPRQFLVAMPGVQSIDL